MRHIDGTYLDIITGGYGTGTTENNAVIMKKGKGADIYANYIAN